MKHALNPSAVRSRHAADRDAKRCDLCGHADFELVSRFDRRWRPLGTEMCRRCGLVSHQRIPTEAELAAFYATEYRREYHGEISPSSRRVSRAWRNAEYVCQRLKPWLAAGSHVLEVGAGIGCTVKTFEQHGYEASGIEPNEGFQRYARERLQATVTKDYLLDLPPQPRYDLVLLVHVIEHFRSPRAALAHLHDLINPGGYLYVECPNLGFAPRHRMFHFAHIHNFTQVTLESLAGCCGVEPSGWFTGEEDVNLVVLLKRLDQPRLTLPTNGYEKAKTALDRCDPWRYYLRWDYLVGRMQWLRSWIADARGEHDLRPSPPLSSSIAPQEATVPRSRAA